MKRTVIAKHYRVEITDEQYLAIERYDNLLEEGPKPWPCGLYSELDNLDGVARTDYSGHFGAYVFLQIMAEDDTPERWEQIETLIRRAGAHQ